MRAPRFLNTQQIDRRRAVLRVAMRLIGDDQRLGYRSREPADRFRDAVLSAALRTLRDADAELANAGNIACGIGAAPVQQKTLDLVTCFNSIGLAGLERMLDDKEAPRFLVPSAACYHPDEQYSSDNIETP